MDEAKARRRYKVLAREKERLDEKGAVDAVINAEIAKLLEAFPSLVEAKTSVSSATQAMLRFGEEMSATESAAVTAAAPAVTTAQQSTAPLHEAKDVSATEPSAKVSSATPAECDSGASPKESPPPMPAPKAASVEKEKSNNNNKALARFTAFLGVVNVTLRLWNDITANPTFGSKNQAKAVMAALICAIVHCHIAEPCSVFTRLADPLLIVFNLHLSAALSFGTSAAAGGSSGSARGWFERVVVYGIRDLVPSLVATYTIFMAYLCWASIMVGAQPKLFCLDD